MAASGDGHDPDRSLDDGELNELLRHDRRRQVIAELHERDTAVQIDDLSEAVAARENVKNPPASTVEASRSSSVGETLLPRFEDWRIREPRRERRTVPPLAGVGDPDDRAAVGPEDDISWGAFYFGLALVGFLTVVAWLLEAPVVSSLDLTWMIAAFFAAQLSAAVYHVYSTDDRNIRNRFGR